MSEKQIQINKEDLRSVVIEVGEKAREMEKTLNRSLDKLLDDKELSVPVTAESAVVRSMYSLLAVEAVENIAKKDPEMFEKEVKAMLSLIISSIESAYYWLEVALATLERVEKRGSMVECFMNTIKDCMKMLKDMQQKIINTSPLKTIYRVPIVILT